MLRGIECHVTWKVMLHGMSFYMEIGMLFCMACDVTWNIMLSGLSCYMECHVTSRPPMSPLFRRIKCQKEMNFPFEIRLIFWSFFSILCFFVFFRNPDQIEFSTWGKGRVLSVIPTFLGPAVLWSGGPLVHRTVRINDDMF